MYSKVIKLCYIFLQILLLYRLLENIEYSSLCYTVGPCWLSILYIIVCIYNLFVLFLIFPPVMKYVRAKIDENFTT